MNREVSEGEMISHHGLFFPTRSSEERRTGSFPEAFLRDAHDFGRLDAGSHAGSPDKGLRRHGRRYYNIRFFCLTCGHEEHGLLVKTVWRARFVHFVAESPDRGS